MNTLTIIKRQIEKQARLHDAQIHITKYRGVDYDTRCVESKEPHGTFCYRGLSYSKWGNYGSTTNYRDNYLGMCDHNVFAIWWNRSS